MFVDLRTCVLALCNYQSGGLWKDLRLMLFIVANLPDMLSLEELCLDVIIIFFPHPGAYTQKILVSLENLVTLP